MTEQNVNNTYKFFYKWGLPTVTGLLASTYEFSLQKRLGREITSKTYLRCLAAAAVGFIFTKYFFTSIDYHKTQNEMNNPIQTDNLIKTEMS